jgi:cytochrome P450
LYAVAYFSGGSEWKRIRSAGNKQILPQRVAKFVTPLSEIADILMEKLEESRDEDGNISDVRDFTVKWSFHGVCDVVRMHYMYGV